MYICICNGVTERRIREAVAAGTTSFEALQERLKVST
ncbi:MAG: (2Fe-2S)-binding protein, partial [Gammaproteobacteria bacterium]